MVPVVVAALGAVLGGIALSAQSAINSQLAKALSDGVIAACVSFGVGFLSLALLSAPRLQALAAGAAGGVPWWAWLGGVLGGVYVFSAIVGVGALGVLTTVAAIALGQTVAALVLDAVGAFGMAVQPISWQRCLAVVFVLAGVVLSRYPG